MERWLSGRKQLTANELTRVTGSLGSNPSLSASDTNSNRWFVFGPQGSVANGSAIFQE